MARKLTKRPCESDSHLGRKPAQSSYAINFTTGWRPSPTGPQGTPEGKSQGNILGNQLLTGVNTKRDCYRADARLTVLMSHTLRRAVDHHNAAVEERSQLRTSLSARSGKPATSGVYSAWARPNKHAMPARYSAGRMGLIGLGTARQRGALASADLSAGI